MEVPSERFCWKSRVNFLKCVLDFVTAAFSGISKVFSR